MPSLLEMGRGTEEVIQELLTRMMMSEEEEVVQADDEGSLRKRLLYWRRKMWVNSLANSRVTYCLEKCFQSDSVFPGCLGCREELLKDKRMEKEKTLWGRTCFHSNCYCSE